MSSGMCVNPQTVCSNFTDSKMCVNPQTVCNMYTYAPLGVNPQLSIFERLQKFFSAVDVQGTLNAYVAVPFTEKVITPIQGMIGEIDLAASLESAKAFAATYGINDDVIADVKGFNPSAYGVDVTTARLAGVAGVATLAVATVLAVKALTAKPQPHPSAGRSF